MAPSGTVSKNADFDLKCVTDEHMSKSKGGGFGNWRMATLAEGDGQVVFGLKIENVFSTA